MTTAIELPVFADARKLTHSRLACLASCPKKHWFRYELGMVSERSSTPLRMGAAVHNGLDALASGMDMESALTAATAPYADVPTWCQSAEDVADWCVEAATVSAMVQGYRERWGDIQFNVIAAEKEFNVPLRNPETSAASKTWTFAGKIDRIIRLDDGRLAVLETKTAGESIEPTSDYWTRLRIDNQISGYMIAARELGHNVECVIYDVLRKPAIRPKNITKAERAAATANGKYFDLPITEQCPERETPEMFGARLLADMRERPDFYFARREIARMASELVLFNGELWDEAKILRERQLSNRWRRNTGACIHPYPCEYQGPCWNGWDASDPMPDGFIRAEKVHAELEL